MGFVRGIGPMELIIILVIVMIIFGVQANRNRQRSRTLDQGIPKLGARRRLDSLRK